MMSFLCEIYVFAVHDYDVQGAFPEVLTAWADGAATTYHTNETKLTRKEFDGVEQSRSITTEGLQAPVRVFSNAQPPKYPPHKLIGYRCDDSIIVSVNNDSSIVVYSIDTVDPADYSSLISAMQDMRPNDPIKASVWTPVYNGLIDETPTENQTQVTAWLDGWRTAYPLATALEFGNEVRRFTGQV